VIIRTQEVFMKTDLDQLLAPHGAGPHKEWMVTAKGRLADALPDDTTLRLNGIDVYRATTCGGLWEAFDHETKRPPTATWLFMRLACQTAIEFVEATTAGDPQPPAEFVHELITADGRHDALAAAWLLLMDEEDRRLLHERLTMALERFASSWSSMASDGRIQFGPASDKALIGGLTLDAKHVDISLDVGAGQAVLLAVSPVSVHDSMFDALGVDAVVHGLATGSPPARVVGWGMGAGEGRAVDVTERWFDDQVSSIRVASRRILQIRDDHHILLDPGSHCVGCPVGNVCEASESDRHSPF